MVIVDTNIWLDVFSGKLNSVGVGKLTRMMQDENVRMHRIVLAEIAVGNLPDRQVTLMRLRALPEATFSWDLFDEWLDSYDAFGLHSGFADVALALSAKHDHAALWTNDAKLQKLCRKLGVELFQF